MNFRATNFSKPLDKSRSSRALNFLRKLISEDNLLCGAAARENRRRRRRRRLIDRAPRVSSRSRGSYSRRV